MHDVGSAAGERATSGCSRTMHAMSAARAPRRAHRRHRQRQDPPSRSSSRALGVPSSTPTRSRARSSSPGSRRCERAGRSASAPRSSPPTAARPPACASIVFTDAAARADLEALTASGHRRGAARRARRGRRPHQILVIPLLVEKNPARSCRPGAGGRLRRRAADRAADQRATARPARRRRHARAQATRAARLQAATT